MAASPAVCEHLHLPLQSGSDHTLARMHRGYTADRYRDRLASARAAIPDLAVTTDIIVGFPGETDADFAATLALADESAFDSVYTFIYSPRPGTEAATMVDDFVAPEVVQARMTQLVDVVERHALVKHEARIGRTEEVLVDGPSKRDPDVLSGRTRQNKLVHFSPAHGVAPGDLIDVEITTAAPHWMRGRIVSDPRPGHVPADAPATHAPERPRIPVSVE
jgi:tRNA-2-methylthio-N6-dimethylallyladenosine synthase